MKSKLKALIKLLAKLRCIQKAKAIQLIIWEEYRTKELSQRCQDQVEAALEM